MILLSYIAERLPWAGVGMILGFILGTTARRVLADTPEGPVTEKPRAWWQPTGMRVLGGFVLILSIASAVQGYVLASRTDELTQCLVRYANTTADAIEARSKASSEAQQAEDQMLLTVLQQQPTDEGRAAARKAVQGYLDKRAEATKAQREHPYPDAPRDLCPGSAGR